MKSAFLLNEMFNITRSIDLFDLVYHFQSNYDVSCSFLLFYSLLNLLYFSNSHDDAHRLAAVQSYLCRLSL
jgi:hypothetical protein